MIFFYYFVYEKAKIAVNKLAGLLIVHLKRNQNQLILDKRTDR